MNEGEKGSSFLTKKLAGLPVWAWALIGLAGVGLGYYLVKKYSASSTGTPASLQTQSSPDLSTANTDASTVDTGTVGNNGIISNPFPETSVNGQTIPVLPSGYQYLYDSTGNVIGIEPIPASANPSPAPGSNPTPTPTPTPAPIPNQPPPTASAKYVHPAASPALTSDLSGIAAANHESLQQLESLNAWIYRQRGTWNLVYPSDNIRVA